MIGAKGIDDLLVARGQIRTRQRYRTPPAVSLRKQVYELPERAPVRSGGRLADVREQVGASIQKFVRTSRPGRALLISSDPGTGKSTAVARAIRHERADARILVGTRALAAEMAAACGYTLIEGRNQHNCLRYDVVRALGEAGHPVERLACGTAATPVCPFRSGCRYYLQFASEGPRVAATEQLFNPNFLNRGTLVVLDDPDLMRAMFDRQAVRLEALSGALDQLEKRPATRQVIQVLVYALVDAPQHWLGGADGWDHLCATAHTRGLDLPGLIRALPKKGTLPKPRGAGASLSVDDVEAVPASHIGRILSALQEELDSFLAGEDFNSRIRISAWGIEVASVRQHARDSRGVLVADMAMLVLDATPVETLVGQVMRHHTRLPSVTGAVELVESVRVVQYATSSNGHTAIAAEARIEDVKGQVAAERRLHPAQGQDEALVVFKGSRRDFASLDFAEDRVLTFGSTRGSNVLDAVQRLHVVGRPMPPTDELHYLAQVLHHGGQWVSPEMTVVTVPFAGTSFATETVDFVDPRMSELLHAAREDEMVQVLHRARLTTVETQRRMDGEPARNHVTVVLHTNQPVSGLRVDELHTGADATTRGLNGLRESEAEAKVATAVQALSARGDLITVEAVRRLAGVQWRTAKKAIERLGMPLQTPAEGSGDMGRELRTPLQTTDETLGDTPPVEAPGDHRNPLHTLKEDPLKRMQSLPKSGVVPPMSTAGSVAARDGPRCRECGSPMSVVRVSDTCNWCKKEGLRNAG